MRAADVWAPLLLLVFVACDGSIEEVDLGTALPRDAGARDTGARDAGARDAGARDAGARDADAPDATASDADAEDAGPSTDAELAPDAEPATDADSPDADSPDADPGTDADSPDADPGDADPLDADVGIDVDPGDADPGDVDPGDVDPGDVDPGDVDPGDVDAPGTVCDEAASIIEQCTGTAPDPVLCEGTDLAGSICVVAYPAEACLFLQSLGPVPGTEQFVACILGGVNDGGPVDADAGIDPDAEPDLGPG